MGRMKTKRDHEEEVDVQELVREYWDMIEKEPQESKRSV